MGKDKEKKDKQSVSMEGALDALAAADMLEGLVQGLRQGTVCVRDGMECVVLKPEGTLSVEIEASHKKDKEKISLKLSWRKAEPVAPSPDGFSITSEEPVLIIEEIVAEPCDVAEAPTEEPEAAQGGMSLVDSWEADMAKIDAEPDLPEGCPCVSLPEGAESGDEEASSGKGKKKKK